jgi:hypothetical protein
MKRSSRLLWALLLAASAARAEAPIVPNTTEKARELFQSGLSLGKEGDLSGALRDFEAAYTARPHYSVLYNIAQTQAALGHPVEAVATLQRYLADGGKRISESRRVEVNALIAAIGQRIGRVRFTGGAKTTRVWLDGRELSVDARGELIATAKGEHWLTISNAAEPPESRVISVDGDKAVDIVLPEPLTVSAPPPILTHLVVTCDTPDIEVEVVGVGGFKTPQTEPFHVPVGRMAVRFSRPGYPLLQRHLLAAKQVPTMVDCEERPLSPPSPQLSARLSLALTPPDANVYIDGRRFSGEMLPAGSHQLRAQRDGFVSFERRISLEAGRTHLQQIVLEETRDERDRKERARSRAHTAGLVLVGLGLGALAASAGVYAWNSDRYDKWQAERQRGTATFEDAVRVQRGDDAVLGLVLSGGLLGIAGAWVYFDAP